MPKFILERRGTVLPHLGAVVGCCCSCKAMDLLAPSIIYVCSSCESQNLDPDLRSIRSQRRFSRQADFYALELVGRAYYTCMRGFKSLSFKSLYVRAFVKQATTVCMYVITLLLPAMCTKARCIPVLIPSADWQIVLHAASQQLNRTCWPGPVRAQNNMARQTKTERYIR
jgi:hypothetical protein